MHFVKITTGDDETRWVNLENVSRATHAIASNGHPLLVLTFNDGCEDTRLSIQGSREADRAAIADLVRQLDDVAHT